MAAYDLLARIHETAGDPGGAQMVLEDAVAISPHMVRRLRHLGTVALDAGDPSAAEKSFKQVVAKARYSEFRDPEDHVNLTRALVKKGDAAGATAVVRDLEKSQRGNTNLDVCKAVSAALLHDATGNAAGAVAELNNAVAALKLSQGLSAGLKLDLARTCLAHRLDNQASQVMLDALSDDGVTTAQAMNVFVKAGRLDLAQSMTSQLKGQVAQLLNLAAEKSKMGDVKGAVQTLGEALRKSPGNIQVMIAAIQAILRQIDELGWDHALAETSTRQLAHLRQLDAAHPELARLTDSFNAAKRKYGIAT
jgi:tetratricopeptide (TPR) repeat protein